MELITQEQKNEMVSKMRKSNVEKRAKEKAPKISLSNVGRKIQKDVFGVHREMLEKIWVIGRGLIFAKHFSKISGIQKTEMYRELRLLEKTGLINIVKFYHQNIIQLTQFSVNQFQKKTRMVALTNANVIKHSFLGEILKKKLEQAVSKDINISHEIFFQRMSEQTNFFRTEKAENSLWKKLDKLRKRDTFCQLSITNPYLYVYVFDIYNAESRRMIERVAEIYHFLDENGITEKLSIMFNICVVDERREKYLNGKHARRSFETTLKVKKLLHLLDKKFSIKIVSYDLTQRVFALTRVVP
ncbi:hypothetical protein [Desulfosporosinus metallidurans]|uniref:Uncharacterized protein n=1 Tax=Desulfosporosinus metallidurans TaxID=1888891 RepID=A0A1Q8R2L3_9FIRM|nr:hypothetical protein [Desulfosporosinus metallidurans]OLN33827.1 hypothetical protein DSOL_0005 [Desulfosporosinus metallidurans]